MQAVIVENVVLLPRTAAKIAANLLVLQSYPQKAQVFASQRTVFVENTVRVQSWKGTLVVLGTGGYSADIFAGHDTQGWPVDAFEPPTFPQTWRYNSVLLNSGTIYNAALDVRARQAVVFAEADTFVQPWKTSVVVLNTFVPYSFSRDVRRARQGVYFQDPESFLRPAPFNELIINGTAQAIVLSVPLWESAWTADSSVITADTTQYSADGADLVNGGGLQIRETNPPGKESGGLAVNVSYILRF